MQTNFDIGKPNFAGEGGQVEKVTMGKIFLQNFQRDGIFLSLILPNLHCQTIAFIK